jgi:hypothetical protein
MKTVRDLKVGDICYFITPLRDAGTITVSEILESMKEPNHYKIKFQEGLTVHAYVSSTGLTYCNTYIYLEKDKAIEDLQYYKRTIERHINKLSNESV